MLADSFRCNDCNAFFKNADFYDEKHGLNNPPFEKIPICPRCKSSNFTSFNLKMDKFDICEKLLPAIARINAGISQIKDVFGQKSNNENIEDGVAMLIQLLSEMFDFLSVDIERKIFACITEKDVERLFYYLKGEL